jgi:glycosyltransferase involved in cell wall biosynthesis
MLRILAVTNIYPTHQFPASGTFVERQILSLRQVGVDVDVLFIDRAREGIRVYTGLRQQIRAKVKNFEPDLVHVMYGGVMADLVTRTVDDRPTIVSFCGSDLLGQPLSGSFRKFVAWYGVLASHRAARKSAGIIVKSRNLLNALPDDVDRSKVQVIPNGVDLDRFRPLDQDVCRSRLSWDASRFNILFPAHSGDPLKRPDLAQAAVEAIKRLGISAEMHWLRGIPHSEVPVWINASDVVLLTSSHEGSPNIIKEALACNVPIVSVDVGDVRERIQGIEGCYLALPEPEDLAAKLCLTYAGQRRIAGRVKVQELSLEHIALRLKAFYREVLAFSGKKS